MIVYIEKCREDAIIPGYQHEGDAGMDVCAAVDIDILPGQTVVVPTGLKLAIPDGYEIQVRPRSGLSLKTALRIPNAPGTIDSGYRDELGIIMTNTGIDGLFSKISAQYNREADGSLSIKPQFEIGEAVSELKQIEENQERFLICCLTEQKPTPCIYRILKGDRIAQLVLKEVPKMEFVEVASIIANESVFELNKAEKFVQNRGGGFGSSGIESKNTTDDEN